jgi:hypothetical protein
MSRGTGVLTLNTMWPDDFGNVYVQYIPLCVDDFGNQWAERWVFGDWWGSRYYFFTGEPDGD